MSKLLAEWPANSTQSHTAALKQLSTTAMNEILNFPADSIDSHSFSALDSAICVIGNLHFSPEL